MNMTLKLNGAAQKIIDGAIKSGLAKTKTDAIILGLVALDYKYRLLELMEDEEDVRESERILEEIKSGKQRAYTQKEFEEKTGLNLKTKK